MQVLDTFALADKIIDLLEVEITCELDGGKEPTIAWDKLTVDHYTDLPQTITSLDEDTRLIIAEHIEYAEPTVGIDIPKSLRYKLEALIKEVLHGHG